MKLMGTEEIFKFYPDEKDCWKHVEDVRWNGNPICPFCDSMNVSRKIRMKQVHPTRYQCSDCESLFNVLTFTIFEYEEIPMQKWFYLLDRIVRHENRYTVVNPSRLARDLGLNKRETWALVHDVYDALEGHQAQFLSDLVRRMKLH